MFNDLLNDSKLPNVYFIFSHGDLFIKLPVTEVEEITEDDFLTNDMRIIGATLYLGTDKVNQIEIYLDSDICKVKKPARVIQSDQYNFCYKIRDTDCENTFFITQYRQ